MSVGVYVCVCWGMGGGICLREFMYVYVSMCGVCVSQCVSGHVCV